MISILIVNWNGMRYLAGCLESIREKVSGDYDVVVVDNDSSDGSADLVAATFPWVKLVRSGENLGFGKGNNLAAKHAEGNVLMLLNYDTVLLADPAPMAEYLLRDNSIGCVGAQMCNGNGVIVPNCGHFPSPARLLLFSSMFWNPYQGAYGASSLGAQRVDWVEGSFALIPRDVWEQVGGFDERIFMYGEDVDLCRSITKAGRTVVHVPRLAYRHYTGWSTSRLPHQVAGFRFYHQKHSKAVERSLADVVLFIGIKVRLICYATLGLLTQRSRYKEKTQALLRVDRLWSKIAEPGFGLR